MFKWFNRSKRRRSDDMRKHRSMDEHYNCDSYNYDDDCETSTDETIRTPEYKQALADFYARRSIGPVTTRTASPETKTRRSLPLTKNKSRRSQVPQIKLVFDNRIMMKPDVLPQDHDDDGCDSPPPLFYKNNSLPYPDSHEEEEISPVSHQIINGKSMNCVHGVLVIDDDEVVHSKYMMRNNDVWSLGLFSTTNVAIKNIPQDKHMQRLTDHDVQMQSVFRHPNILLLMGLVYADNSITKCIYEPCEMSLHHYIHNQGCDDMKMSNYIKYMMDVTDAVSYLNKMGYLHTNISSNNIMITNNQCAKITSLYLCCPIHNNGCSCAEPQYVNMSSFRKYLNESVKKCSGQKFSDRELCSFNDFRYNAPELFDVINGVVYPHVTTDVYSLCMVLLHCFTGEIPFQKYDHKELTDIYILWKNGVRLPDYDDDTFPKTVHNICTQGLCMKPENRISIEKLMELLKQAQITINSNKQDKSFDDIKAPLPSLDEEEGDSDNDNSDEDSDEDSDDKSTKSVNNNDKTQPNNQSSMNNTDSTEYCPLLTPQVKRFLSRSNFSDSKYKSTFLFNETDDFSISEKSEKVFRLNLSITPKFSKSFHIETAQNKMCEEKNISLPINCALKDDSKKAKICINLVNKSDFLSLPTDFGSSKNAENDDPYTSLDFHSKLSLFNNNYRSKKYSERCKSEECINTGVNINSLVAKHEKWISQNNQSHSTSFTLPIYYKGIKPASHLISPHHSSTPKPKSNSNKPNHIHNHILKQTFEQIHKTQSHNNVVKPSNIREHFKNITNENKVEDMYIDDEFPANTDVLSPNMQLVPLHAKHQADCQEGNKCCIQHIQHLTHSDHVYIICHSNKLPVNNNTMPLTKIEEDIIEEVQSIVIEQEQEHNNTTLSDDIVHL